MNDVPMNDLRTADVAVIGAGFSGLAAAAQLKASGVDVVVLEARERVGGRTDSAHLSKSAWLDLGGTWIGPAQTRMHQLAAEHSVEVFDQFDDGQRLLELSGKISRYKGTIPRLGPLTLIDVARLQFGVARAAKKVAAGRPGAAEHAAEFDRLTLDQWLTDRRCGAKARALLTAAGKTIWGAEPKDLSLYYALRYINGAGGLDALLDTEGGAQHSRLLGGAQGLAEKIAGGLGERVLFGHEVKSISSDESGVSVGGEFGQVRAQRAILALPPPLCAKIDFSPTLPEARGALQAKTRMGALTKCFAIFDTPFWREDGLCGEAVSDEGPATLTFDVSPPDASCGVLLGFVGGSDARALDELDQAQAREAVLAGMARLFGERATRPDDYHQRTWTREEFSGGGPVMIAPPGALAGNEGALSERAGRLHFAGTEAAPQWSGYIEGAVVAGESAAAEVAQALL